MKRDNIMPLLIIGVILAIAFSATVLYHMMTVYTQIPNLVIEIASEEEYEESVNSLQIRVLLAMMALGFSVMSLVVSFWAFSKINQEKK